MDTIRTSHFHFTQPYATGDFRALTFCAYPEGNNIVHVGLAACSVQDPWDRKVGRKIASGRVMKQYASFGAQEGIQLPFVTHYAITMDEKEWIETLKKWRSLEEAGYLSSVEEDVKKLFKIAPCKGSLMERFMERFDAWKARDKRVDNEAANLNAAVRAACCDLARRKAEEARKK